MISGKFGLKIAAKRGQYRKLRRKKGIDIDYSHKLKGLGHTQILGTLRT